MTITLGPELEAAVQEWARREGVAPETLVRNAVRDRLAIPVTPSADGDEWERLVREAGSDCGVSLSHAALGSEGLYE